ncbi:MAG: hypothetical protein JXR31_03340 [Prolixibacteraceae bacterium]|nr:hypothetical protein [Prolixibacteraceae bacterium]MBN2773257.1 hypothetical protein [Prolixibacteraceae bacterium]
MKRAKIISILLFLLLAIPAFFVYKVSAQETKKVQVYYFHNTRRCETCLAIEKETKNALQENFSDQMEEGTVTFSVYNFDDDINKKIISDLKVEGQSLFVIKDDKRVDLTDKGFLFARTDPEKFKQIVKDAIGEI